MARSPCPWSRRRSRAQLAYTVASVGPYRLTSFSSGGAYDVAIDSNKKGDVKMEITNARQAVQRAEDARIVTLRKQPDELARNQEDAKQKAQQEALAFIRSRLQLASP